MVLKDTVERPGEVAREQAGRFGGDVGFVYRHALKGYSVRLPAPAVAALERDPRVRFVSRDHEVGIFAQSIPTGIRRTFAASSPYLDIDGVDDFRVEADVAVLDTGVDFDHPDLDVVGRTNCTTGQCVDGTGDDGNGHGTHVAGTIGAIDNGQGVVGVAPGARLWGVKVLGDGGSGQESWIVAGVDWATARAGQIEVVNMSLGCGCALPALAVAITNSVDAGVAYAVAAGNFSSDAANFSPANHPDVITVSALADFDGLPGGLGNANCPDGFGDGDDTLASFSNWGSAVEVTAPGVCIFSTWKNAGYNTISGTSMASPHVAGAAAFLASRANPSTRADVMAIRAQIVDAGNFAWVDDSGDGVKEPLLDVSSFAPATPPEPDVDGDGLAELVSVDSAGRAHALGPDGSNLTDLGVDPALLDGRGGYVVDVADVGGDGRSDLVMWGHGGGVSVRPGQSDKSFGSPVSSLSGFDLSLDGDSSGAYEPIAVADVNGDGRGDLVAHNRLVGVLAAAPGQADGTFGAFTTSSATDSALFDGAGDYFVDASDVTGEGRADVVALASSGSAKVYRGQADGTFAAGLTAASVDPVMDDGQGEEPVGVADTNNDGRADLVSLNALGTLRIYRGRTDGTFEAPTIGFAEPVDSSLLDGAGLELVGLLDYNGDGRADLVAIDDQHHVWTYAAQLSTFASPTAGYGSATVRSVRRDAPVAWPFEIHEPATEKPLLRRPGCTASGCRWRSAPADSDVTGDGRAELVTIDSSDASDQPRTYFGTNGGVRTSGYLPIWSSSLEPGPALFGGIGWYVVDVSDVDGDGRSDLVTWNSAGGVGVRTGGYDGRFAAHVTSHLGSNPSWDGEQQGAYEPIAVADSNGDGRGDLIAIWQGASSGWLARAYGRADGTFYPFATSTSADSALFDGAGDYFIDAADVTGDRRADVVSLATSGSAKVYQSNVDGELMAPVTAASVNPVMDDGLGEEPVGLGDVDFDGRADLVTFDGSGALKLYKGKADATFEAPVSAYAGTIDSSLLDGTGRELVGLLDYNRDGRADLVAIDEQGQVWSYRAQPDATFAAPTSGGSSGWAPTVRIHGAQGHEPAYEKNIQRRVGCNTNGCTWPPTP